MKSSTLLFAAAVLFSLPVLAAEKSTEELQKEYEQVRQIALKDPKVRAAFDRANEKLNDRIIEIDPALKPLVQKQPAPLKPFQEKEKKSAPKPVAKTQPKATQTKHDVAASSGKAGVTHTVEKGETLSSIAMKYHVSTATLKKANGIADEKKLQAGQKLLIPGARAPHSTAAASSQKSDESWWEKLKKTW